ncbi:MAG TPA: hypothetical protein VK447_14600, partial [Myxococcaceae bacterium]|nr:hypothetical protein [Myxococcaceae bacterium]
MKTAHTLEPRGKQHGHRGPRSRLVEVMLLALTAACAPSPEDFPAPEMGLASGQAALADRGLTTNGLTPEGLTHHGLTTNGLASRGLTHDALLAVPFSNWFNSSPASRSDMVMRYVVKCAVPANSARTWTNPVTGVTYIWSGSLGLAPGWAAGNPITVPEQQLITACLAGYVNKFGRSVVIS